MHLDSLLLQKEAERMADAHARHTTETFIVQFVVIIVWIDFVDDWYNNHHSTDNHDNIDCSRLPLYR